MAQNFNLFQFQNRDSLHIQMRGDFDGTSAHELINALKRQKQDYCTVYIDTNALNQIHNFGIDVFQKNWITGSTNLVFIGKHNQRFAG